MQQVRPGAQFLQSICVCWNQIGCAQVLKFWTERKRCIKATVTFWVPDDLQIDCACFVAYVFDQNVSKVFACAL